MMDPEAAHENGAAKPAQSTPWQIHALRIFGSVTAVACLVFGVFACITVFATCLIAGLIQILLGMVVGGIEATCLFGHFEIAKKPAAFFENKPLWMRSVLYISLSLLPLSMCFALSTIFGSGLAFILGCLYIVITFRKKAPANQARNEDSRF